MGLVETENANLPGVAEEVLAIRGCLDCRSPLRQRADGLACPECGRQYPMLNGVIATWRVDTFDWCSPWYQSKHTYQEVFRGLEDCGLQNLKVIERPIAVQGTRLFADNHNSVNDQSREVARCAE